MGNTPLNSLPCGKTIHRMLELSGGPDDDRLRTQFERNQDNPLETDVVIIDEMSMVDIYLMNALLKAIAVGTRLILVGDVNQLPSVGPGNVLKDIIDSECFQVVRLTKIFRHDYKLDENGITIRYRSSVFRTVRRWGECDCLGVECLIYPKITCSRDIGGSVLEISYTPEIWDKMSVYMARHGVKVLEPDLQQIWYKQQRKNPKSICALQDIQGELKISDQTFYGKKLNGRIKPLSVIVIALMLFGWYVILAFEYGSLLRYAWLLLIIAVIAGWIIYGEDAEWGNEWIVSRTGIQITTRRSKKVIFYEWSQINRVGVGSCGSEAAFFYIFFTANGKFKKMRVRFTEKRYKEFLAFVPEGKETDPMTSDYQIRWRSAMRSYGKSRDDFDEW